MLLKKKKNSHKGKRFVHSTRQRDSNVTGQEELRAMHPDFTWKLIFRKLAHLLSFGVVLKKNTHNYLKKLSSTSYLRGAGHAPNNAAQQRQQRQQESPATSAEISESQNCTRSTVTTLSMFVVGNLFFIKMCYSWMPCNRFVKCMFLKFLIE